MIVGKILRSRYKIIKLLGKGGFAETYLAEDLDIPVDPKPMCVVKRLQPQAIVPEIVRLFQQEGAVLYKLGQQHDRIPKLFAYFQENNEFFLIQELIDGLDLSTEILPGKPWTESEVVKLLQEILEVLAFVHQQNIIHRDIKPKNLMRRRTDGKIVLIDFGAVKEVGAMQVNAQGQTSQTVGIGTPGYMPDEQANGKPRLSSDVYAVGILGIQALTGLSPSQLPENLRTGENVWRDRANVSDLLAGVLDTMVKPFFSQRYPSAIEALEALTIAATALKTPQSTQSTTIVWPPSVPPTIPHISSPQPNETTAAQLEAPSNNIKTALKPQPTTEKSTALDPIYLERCQQELARYIGPVARFILEDTLVEHPGIIPQQLVELLANEIPNPQKAKQFKEHLL